MARIDSLCPGAPVCRASWQPPRRATPPAPRRPPRRPLRSQGPPNPLAGRRRRQAPPGLRREVPPRPPPAPTALSSFALSGLPVRAQGKTSPAVPAFAWLESQNARPRCRSPGSSPAARIACGRESQWRGLSVAAPRCSQTPGPQPGSWGRRASSPLARRRPPPQRSRSPPGPCPPRDRSACRWPPTLAATAVARSGRRCWARCRPRPRQGAFAGRTVLEAGLPQLCASPTAPSPA